MAQLVAQLIRNQQVKGSSPFVGSRKNRSIERFFCALNFLDGFFEERYGECEAIASAFYLQFPDRSSARESILDDAPGIPFKS